MLTRRTLPIKFSITRQTSVKIIGLSSNQKPIVTVRTRLQLLNIFFCLLTVYLSVCFPGSFCYCFSLSLSFVCPFCWSWLSLCLMFFSFFVCGQGSRRIFLSVFRFSFSFCLSINLFISVFRSSFSFCLSINLLVFLYF